MIVGLAGESSFLVVTVVIGIENVGVDLLDQKIVFEMPIIVDL